MLIKIAFLFFHGLLYFLCPYLFKINENKKKNILQILNKIFGSKVYSTVFNVSIMK